MMLRKDVTHIVDAVCAFYKVSFAQINSASQIRETATVRQELMTLLREFTDLSLQRVGQLMGGRDPSTVTAAVSRVTVRALADADYADHFAKLRRYVESYDPSPSGVGAIERARRCMAAAPGPISAEVRDLGMTVLMTASILASRDLTDAEARAAALQILNRGVSDDAAA